MNNQLALLGKSLLYSEQIRRENGSLHTQQKHQATTIEVFRSKHEQQDHLIETLQERLAAVEHANAQLISNFDKVNSDAAKTSVTQAAMLRTITDLRKDDLAAALSALQKQLSLIHI